MATKTAGRRPRTGKEKVRAILEELPDDSTFDDVLHELAFARMIEEGIADADAGRVKGLDEVRRIVESWSR